MIHFFFNLNSPLFLFCQFTSRAEHISCCSHSISGTVLFDHLILWKSCEMDFVNLRLQICWRLHWPCGVCWPLCMHYPLYRLYSGHIWMVQILEIVVDLTSLNHYVGKYNLIGSKCLKLAINNWTGNTSNAKVELRFQTNDT